MKVKDMKKMVDQLEKAGWGNAVFDVTPSMEEGRGEDTRSLLEMAQALRSGGGGEGVPVVSLLIDMEGFGIKAAATPLGIMVAPAYMAHFGLEAGQDADGTEWIRVREGDSVPVAFLAAVHSHLSDSSGAGN